MDLPQKNSQSMQQQEPTRRQSSLSPTYPFSLEHFEIAIHADQNVLAMVYTGSLGRGTCDQFSDLDIYLWVTEEAFVDSTATVYTILEYLGDIQYHHVRFSPQGITVRGLVGPRWQRVDLGLYPPTYNEPSTEYAHARIIKDTHHFLAQLVAHSPQENVNISWVQAREMIEDAIDTLDFLSLHNARGAHWSAMGTIGYQTCEMYCLLALLRGYRSYGFRFVEQILSLEELALLSQTWPQQPTRQEIQRAAYALWKWIRYVWKEAERVLGSLLQIHIDEAAFLSAIEHLYRQS